MTVSASASGNRTSGTNIAALSSGSVAPWRPPARAPMTEHKNRQVAARSAALGFTWLAGVGTLPVEEASGPGMVVSRDDVRAGDLPVIGLRPRVDDESGSDDGFPHYGI